MYRLVSAILLALALHVLLLFMMVPVRKTLQPEIRGTGRVTVSIIQPAPSVSETREKPLESLDMGMAVEKEVGQKHEMVETLPEKLSQSEEASSLLPEPVKEKEDEPVEFPAVKPRPQSETQPVQQSEPNIGTPEDHTAKPLYDQMLQTVSDAETLQDPVPVEHLNRPPEYPALARKRGWEGTVVLEVDIRRDGVVREILVKQSSSYGLLDKEAARAVRAWRFQPGTRAGEPVQMKVLVPVHFLLQDQ